MFVFGIDRHKIEALLTITIRSNKLKCMQSSRNSGLYLNTNLRFKERVRKYNQSASISFKIMFSIPYFRKQHPKLKLTDVPI